MRAFTFVPLVLSSVLVVHAGAQSSVANFDSAVEGLVGTTYTVGAITFSDLQATAGGPLQPFAFESAAAFGGLQDASAPNVLGLGTFAPGSGFASTPMHSLRVTIPPSRSIELTVVDLGSPAFNVLQVDLFAGGVVNGGFTLQFSGAPAPRSVRLSTYDQPLLTDELRIRGSGAADGGRFRIAFDSILVSTEPNQSGTAYCPGDAAAACPCGNGAAMVPPSLRGCANSSGSGAFLAISGIASLSGDTQSAFASEHMINGSIVLAQGTSPASGTASFGDGLQCLGGGIVRIGAMENFVPGTAVARYPGTGQAPISVRGGITAPGTRWYQAYYRNAATFCTSSPMNSTNGIELVWGP